MDASSSAASAVHREGRAILRLPDLLQRAISRRVPAGGERRAQGGGPADGVRRRWGDDVHLLMQRRDPEGGEPAAIAATVDLAGKRVLEVGCGAGRLTSFAAPRAAYVYAFDPDP